MHYTCGGYRGDYDEGCSSHYINEEDLKALLTEYLRIMTKRIIQDEAAFIRELSEKWKLHQESIPARANEDLKHTQERYAELGSRLTKLYEDFAAGLLPERQYRTLMCRARKIKLVSFPISRDPERMCYEVKEGFHKISLYIRSDSRQDIAEARRKLERIRGD